MDRRGERRSHPGLLGWGAGMFLLLLAWGVIAAVLARESVPGPGVVFRAFVSTPRLHLSHVTASGKIAALGLALSSLWAALLAISAGVFPFSRHLLLLFSTILKASPVIVFAAPLQWLLGSGAPAKVAVAMLISFYPMFIGALRGIDDVPVAIVDQCRILRVSPMRKFWLIDMRYCLAGLSEGAKVSAPLSVVGAVVGEYMIGGSQVGLGQLLMDSVPRMAYPVVFLAGVEATVLGLVMYGVAASFSTLARAEI